MKSLLLAVASVAAAATLLSASCRGIPTFLIDPDLDDDGVVTQADVDTATACLGTVLPTAPSSYDPGGCPLRPGPRGTRGAGGARGGRRDARPPRSGAPRPAPARPSCAAAVSTRSRTRPRTTRCRRASRR